MRGLLLLALAVLVGALAPPGLAGASTPVPAASPDIEVRVSANSRAMDLQAEGIDLAIRYGLREAMPAGAQRLFGEEIVACPRCGSDDTEIVALLAVGRGADSAILHPGRRPVDRIAFDEAYGAPWEDLDRTTGNPAHPPGAAS